MSRLAKPRRARRPTVIACLAMSLDGKIAAPDRGYFRFTGERDRRHLDRWRAWADAVIVGAGTIRAEGFAQKVRFAGARRKRRAAGKPAQPLNVCLSRRLDLPFPSRYFSDPAVCRWLFCSDRAPARAIARLRRAALVTSLPERRFCPAEVVRRLAGCGLSNLLLEGGGELLAAFLKEGLVDRLYVTIAPRLIGGRGTPGLVGGEGFAAGTFPRLKLAQSRRAGGELYLCYRVCRSG